MQDAVPRLTIICERSHQGKPLTNAYRMLDNPSLSLYASGCISGHAGALTPGGTGATVRRRYEPGQHPGEHCASAAGDLSVEARPTCLHPEAIGKETPTWHPRWERSAGPGRNPPHPRSA
jgi:hypothetical protein